MFDVGTHLLTKLNFVHLPVEVQSVRLRNSRACPRHPSGLRSGMTRQLKIVVEKHSDGYVAYPLGLARGVIVGQGDTRGAALSDVRSAIAFHVETFGAAALAPPLTSRRE